MLGLVTFKEAGDVVDFDNDREDENIFSGATRRFFETYNKRPGFFAPYKSGNEFAGGVLATVIYPAELAGIAILAGLTAAIAPIVCIGSLIVAGTASLFGYTDVANEAINAAITSFLVTGMAILATAATLLLAVVSPIHALASLLTRSFATVGRAAYDCIVGPKTIPTENTGKVDADYELELYEDDAAGESKEHVQSIEEDGESKEHVQSIEEDGESKEHVQSIEEDGENKKHVQSIEEDGESKGHVQSIEEDGENKEHIQPIEEDGENKEHVQSIEEDGENHGFSMSM